MRKQGKSSIVGLVLGFILLVLVGGVVYLFSSSLFEREAPKEAVKDFINRLR